MRLVEKIKREHDKLDLVFLSICIFFLFTWLHTFLISYQMKTGFNMIQIQIQTQTIITELNKLPK
jgi:hypothetical protein